MVAVPVAVVVAVCIRGSDNSLHEAVAAVDLAAAVGALGDAEAAAVQALGQRPKRALRALMR